MEKEHVLQWLRSVQTATHAEADGGLLNPDSSISESSYDPTNISFLRSLKEPKEHSQSSQQPELKDARQVQSPSSFQIPQDPSATTKRKFQLSRSKTLSSEGIKDGVHAYRKALECDTDECSMQELRDSCIKFRQSSQSPFLASNPEVALPTIALTHAPPRKPLVRQSSTTFLSELKTKATLQSQLLPSSGIGSVDLPERGKSAPSSPNLQNSRRSGVWDDQTVLGSGGGKCYSQGDVRQPAERTDWSDGDSGSCVAKKGGLSDASSGDMDMLYDAWGGASSRKNIPLQGPLAELRNGGDFRMESSSHEEVLLSPELTEDRLLPENVQSNECLPEETSRISPRPKRFPLARQATVESSSSPSPLSEVSPQIQFKNHEGDDNKPSRLPSFLSKQRNSLERSSSVVKHHRSLSDNTSQSSGSDHIPPLGLDSLAFHDHHLGRKGSQHGMVRSTTFDDYSVRRGSNPISPSFTKPPKSSLLLGNKRVTTKHCKSKMSVGSMLHSDVSDRIEKLKASSAAPGWLSKAA